MKYYAILIFLLSLSISSLSSQSFERSLLNFNIDKSEIFNYKDYQHQVVLKVKDISDSDSEIRLKFFIADTNQIFILIKTLNGTVDLIETPNTFKYELKSFEGQIKNNLYQSVLNDIGSESLAKVISHAFEKEFSNTKKLRVDAFYSFSVETITEDNGEQEFGLIESAKIIVGKATIEKESIFDLDSEISTLVTKHPTLHEKVFSSPVYGQRVSSLFNLHRKHPITKRIQPHNGIDFVAKSGTPVYPALEGTIIAIAKARAKGNFILIDHGNGFQSTYDHLKKFQRNLKIGDYVTENDQIGEVGKTGYATGAHLHFALIKDGFYVNPLNYFKNIVIDSPVQNETEINIEIEPLWINFNDSFFDLDNQA